MNAAEKAAVKEQEQRTRFAVENAMKNAAVEAAKKEQQYEEETTIALENSINKAAVPTTLVDRLPSWIQPADIRFRTQKTHRYGGTLTDYIEL